MRKLIFTALMIYVTANVQAVLVVDSTDPDFERLVSTELLFIKERKRGLACQILLERLQAASATVTIKPVTKDENTWHPNDRRGTRSHTVALDTKIQGAERLTPTPADVFIHPSRIDPKLSLFKVGTFVRELAMALDLAEGHFSKDYRMRERRAFFFVNAWRDALNLSLISTSDRIETTDYQYAKNEGLLSVENASLFPLIQPAATPLPVLTPP